MHRLHITTYISSYAAPLDKPSNRISILDSHYKLTFPCANGSTIDVCTYNHPVKVADVFTSFICPIANPYINQAISSPIAGSSLIKAINYTVVIPDDSGSNWLPIICTYNVVAHDEPHQQPNTVKSILCTLPASNILSTDSISNCSTNYCKAILESITAPHTPSHTRTNCVANLCKPVGCT